MDSNIIEKMEHSQQTNKINDFQIITNVDASHGKWLTLLSNCTSTHYKNFMDFGDNTLSYFTKPQRRKEACNFLRTFFLIDNRMPILKTDSMRNPTLEEFLTIKGIIENAQMKYNRKTKQLIIK